MCPVKPEEKCGKATFKGGFGQGSLSCRMCLSLIAPGTSGHEVSFSCLLFFFLLIIKTCASYCVPAAVFGSFALLSAR